MSNLNTDLSICSFNCRSVKSSLPEIYQLCESHSIVCIQEHWLLPDELNMMSQIHPDFLSSATSAVAVDSDVLTGRPYGGTAILFKQSLANAVSVVDTDEPRMTAILIRTGHGPILLVNVYMPTDYGTFDCVEEYLDVCTKINVLFSESEAAFLVVIGDFNCEYSVSSRFYDSFTQLMSDNHVVCSDVKRLVDAFSYCSDNGMHTSWIDHVLCSKILDDRIVDIGMHYNYQSSDHKPMFIKFTDLDVTLCPNAVTYAQQLNVRYDWDNANLEHYRDIVHSTLNEVDIPNFLFGCSHDCQNDAHRLAIDDYYNSIVSCIQHCTETCVPVINSRHRVFNVPGWTDFVQEKHDVARVSYLDWLAAGKPRSGHVHQIMCRTRADFKLALRRCKAAEEQLRADARAAQLANKQNPKAFWHGINKDNCRKVTGHVNKVGDATGAQEVCEMWKNQYNNLYNKLDNNKSMKDYYEQVNCSIGSQPRVITVEDISAAVNRQKRNKSAGPNGIYMESLMYAGHKLNVHLSFLFTFCNQHCYLPDTFTESVILPQVKNKCANLTDVDNYRAIAISNAETKILETVILQYVNDAENCDMYQFGFKKSHSTGLCTSAVKRTIDYYLKRGSYVFTCFVDFRKAFDMVNYWKLFTQMLRDGTDLCFVKLLVFWYSHQTLCVYWQGYRSDKFCVGNGTRQGGVLSPYLFTRFVRPLISAISQSRLGCNIGGMFVNLFAYADDMVMLAPSWHAMQALIKLLDIWCAELDIECNTKKTVCMIFKPRNKTRYITDDFPNFILSGCALNFVSEFRYLGHVLNDKLNDDDDICREIKGLFVRTNMLISRFRHCSKNVKLVLFRSFCLCMYDVALWKYYSVTVLRKFRAAYNKCIKKLFGYHRRDSMSGIFLELGLPTADTIVHNSRVLFAGHCSLSCNHIVQWFANIAVW